MPFLLHGLMLILCGAVAIVLAEIATFATGLIVGAALVVAGLGQILKAFEVKSWGGFIWNLSTGIVEVVGGALIYLNPVAGSRCYYNSDCNSISCSRFRSNCVRFEGAPS
jgi:uncharacterized membrane protein HdeD (DUF308 family)